MAKPKQQKAALSALSPEEQAQTDEALLVCAELHCTRDGTLHVIPPGPRVRDTDLTAEEITLFKQLGVLRLA